MAIDIRELAQLANAAVSDEGFMGCTVESEEDRLLAFAFDSHINSHAFLATRELHGMQAHIDDRRPTVVIVRQP